MRLFWLTSLAVMLGCAPQPSAVPLGGNEWVRPERVVDRRPHGESGSDTEPSEVRVATPLPAVEPSARTAVKEEAKPAETGDVRFELRPMAIGTTITLDGRFKLKAAITMNVQGVTSSQTVEFEAEEQIKARISEARGDEVAALEVEYVKSHSTFRMPGSEPDEDDTGAGKRYRVTVQGGSLRIQAVGFALEPDEDKQVQRDLATIVGYVPIVKPHLPASIATGWRHELRETELSTIFASSSGARFSDGKLSLLGRDPSGPDRALFDCGVSAQFEKDGASVSSDLHGKCVVRPSDTRPIEASLKGDLRATTPLPFGADSSILGSVELEFKQSYANR